MGIYAQVDDVLRRLPYVTLSGTKKPSTTDIEEWILEAEADLEGAMLAADIPVPLTTTRGRTLCKMWASDYAEGMTRRALAASGGDGDNDDGAEKLLRFDNIIRRFSTEPSRMDAMLANGSAGDDTRRVRSYVTDNSDSVTRSSSGIVPNIKKGDLDSQF